MAYENGIAGKPQQIPRKGLCLVCCDCGLAHVYQFKIVGKRLYQTVWRNVKITRSVRRRKQYRAVRKALS